MEILRNDPIPTVDLQGLSWNENDLGKIAGKIHAAFTTIGFVRIINHNVSSTCVHKAWDKIDEFLNLSDNIKDNYRRNVRKISLYLYKLAS